MMHQMFLPRNLRTKLAYAAALGVVLSVALSIGLGGKAHAAAVPTGNFPAMPAEVTDYLANCGYTNNSNAQTAWLSPPGDPSTTADISVNYGQASVPIQYNVAGVVCSAVDHNLISTNTKVVSTSPTVPSLDGQILGYTYGPNQGDVSITSMVFNYGPGGGFTNPGTYTIFAEDKKINYFASLGYQCVVSPGFPASGKPADGNDFGACNSRGGSTLRMNVTINDRPVRGGLFAWGCDLGDFTYAHRNNNTYTVQAGLVGSMQDPDYDWTQVHVYINHVDPNDLNKQVFVGAYDASQYPLTLNGTVIGPGKPPYGTGVPNWHDWFVVPKADLDRFGDAYQHDVFVYGIGRNPDGSMNGNNLELYHQPDGGRASLNSCVPPACTVTITPGSPEVGVSYTAQLNYTYSPGSQGRAIAPLGTMNLNGVQTFAFPSSRTGASHPFGPYVQAGPGSLTANATISQAEFNKPCSSSFNIAAKPYLKVFGNDVAAGGKFMDSPATGTCTPGAKTTAGQPPASIWAFNKKVTSGSGTYYGGASSQFGALALGQIYKFNTAGTRNGLTAPTTPNDLSFGNMINNGGTPTGVTEDNSGYSGMYRCIPDYYSASKDATKNPVILPGGTTIAFGFPQSIPDSSQVVRFVDGDAYINANITFQNTSWSDTSAIPSYYLIAKGNIYIGPNVTQLDGVYIAQPRDDGTKGTIYTCTNGLSLFLAKDIYNNCQKNLTITGSFIANQVKFQRARGTVENSIPNPTPTPASVTTVWSSAGNPGGANCFATPESGSPSWDDNWLCTSQPNFYWAWLPGISASAGYRHAGDSCFSWAPRHHNTGAWLDNAVCWPASTTNPQFSWSSSNDLSKNCTLVYEPADPDTSGTGWMVNSWLCTPKPVAQPYIPFNEGPPATTTGLDGNIAEIFNFSQEMYLAPTPSILDSVIGNTTGSNVYQSITSLPPVL